MFLKNLAEPLLEINFFKQDGYIGYVIVKLSNYAEISLGTSTNSFFTKDSLKMKK